MVLRWYRDSGTEEVGVEHPEQPTYRKDRNLSGIGV